MSTPLEDRLRAYYRDREAQAGPDGNNDNDDDNDDKHAQEEHMHRLIAEAETRGGPPIGGGRGWDTAPIRIAAIAALVLALVGASLVLVSRQEDPGPSTGPDPDGEELPAPTTPSTSTPSTTEPTTSTTDDPTTSTTGGTPADLGRSSVVSLYGEMGGGTLDGWTRVDQEGWESPAPGPAYQVVHLDGTITESTSRAGQTCFGDEMLEVDLPAGAIAVRGVDDPLPRPVEQLDPSSAVYRTATTEVMADLGIDDPDPDVRQVVRTDLDGDGRDEVIVAARRMTGDTLIEAPVGNYTVVFVRRTDGAQVATEVVVSSVVTAERRYLDDHEVAAVADLNGDGRMEVVVDTTYYESGGTGVFEMTDEGRYVLALANGCGP